MKERVIEPDSPWSFPRCARPEDRRTSFLCGLQKAEWRHKEELFPANKYRRHYGYARWSQVILDPELEEWLLASDPAPRRQREDRVLHGLWQFTVIPFGPCNAPATFERLEATLTKPVWCTWVMLSLSAGYSRNRLTTCGRCSRGSEEPASNLSRRSAKCQEEEERYPGHVSLERVTTDTQKLKAVRGTNTSW